MMDKGLGKGRAMDRATVAALGVLLAACGVVYAVPHKPEAEEVLVRVAEGAARAATEAEAAAAPADAGSEPSGETGEAARREREEAVRRQRELSRVHRTLRARQHRQVEFDSVALPEVLKFLGELGSFSVVFDPDLAASGIDLAARTITMNLSGMTYEDALYLLLPYECGYRVEAGYILVTTLEKSWQPLRTGTYSVQLLLAEVPNFEGPRFDVGGTVEASSGGGGGMDWLTGDVTSGEETGRATPDRIIELVQKFVRHENDRRIAPWADEGGPATIEYLGGRLVISQTYEGHKAVARLLRLIR